MTALPGAEVERGSERSGTITRFATLVLAGMICGIMSAILSIGAASLVVATYLSGFFPLLIGTALLSAGVLTLTFSLVGPTKSTVATVQAMPSVALGGVVGATVGSMSATDGNVFLTAMIAVALGTVTAGIGMLVLGTFRLGEVVRLIPYPVIGGFLAGSGWLILLGGLGIILAVPATPAMFASIPEPAALVRLGLAGVFVLALWLARRRLPSHVALPTVILIAVAIFNLVRFWLGATESDIHVTNWVIPLPDRGDLWHRFNPVIFSQIYWPAVAAGALHFPTLVVLTTIGLLLNTTAVELERSDDTDLNRDLNAEGVGNVIAGLLGGPAGFNAVGPSLIATRFGVHSRWVGVIAGGTIFAVLLLGTHLLDIFPTFILGGILIWVGGSLLLDWLTVRQIAYSDLAIIFLIFGTIAVFGFGFGILAGLIAAAALFIYRYSKVDVVRQQLTGNDFRSDLVGSSQRQELLHQLGQAIYIVRLHGFLFFGTANRLRLQMQERVRQLGASGHGFLVIDFRQVTGVDTSVSSSFVRLRQAAAANHVTIVLTGLAADARRTLLTSNTRSGEAAAIHVEPDLESGVSWCEDALLAEAAGEATTEKRPLVAILTEVVGDGDAAEKIAGYCQRATAAAGVELVAQGTPAADIIFIEAGHGSVEVAGSVGTPVHVATIDAGDIVGEIGFYLGDRRAASVVARDEMVVWRLSREAIERLQHEAPEVALRFHRGMAAMLSRRLASTSRHVSILAG